MSCLSCVFSHCCHLKRRACTTGLSLHISVPILCSLKIKLFFMLTCFCVIEKNKCFTLKVYNYISIKCWFLILIFSFIKVVIVQCDPNRKERFKAPNLQPSGCLLQIMFFTMTINNNIWICIASLTCLIIFSVQNKIKYWDFIWDKEFNTHSLKLCQVFEVITIVSLLWITYYLDYFLSLCNIWW